MAKPKRGTDTDRLEKKMIRFLYTSKKVRVEEKMRDLTAGKGDWRISLWVCTYVQRDYPLKISQGLKIPPQVFLYSLNIFSPINTMSKTKK